MCIVVPVEGSMRTKIEGHVLASRGSFAKSYVGMPDAAEIPFGGKASPEHR